jgi:hypothetical protein
MPASKDTLKAVHDVLMRHITWEQAVAIATDLLEVPGNSSFRKTVVDLSELFDVATDVPFNPKIKERKGRTQRYHNRGGSLD